MTIDLSNENLTDLSPAVPQKPDERKSWRRRITLPSLSLSTSERKMLLAIVDFSLLSIALIVAVAAWTDYPISASLLFANVKWFITLAVVWFASAFFFNVYDLARSASTFNIVRSISAAVLVAVLLYTFIPALTPPLQSRGLLYTFFALAWIGIILWRMAYALLFVQPWFSRRALMVGAGWAGRTLASELKGSRGDANPYRGTGYELLGFIDDSAAYHNTIIEGTPVLAGRDKLVSLAQSMQVDEIILAITHRHDIHADLFDDLLRCRELGLPVITMPTLYERLLGRVPVLHLGRDLHMIVRAEETASERLYDMVKRAIDIIGGVVGLFFVALAIPFLALANLIASPGPLFYRQQRVGQGGETFSMIKFRSMAPNAEQETGAVWAKKNDSRITSVGKFIRRTRLDELPQFFNVLRGEMSLIGPRPERPEFVDDLAKQIPFYRARHAVKPGITGWAQVRYSYGSCEEDARIKLEYDLYYVRHQDFWLDLNIMLRTIPVMLQFQGH